jgi:hypothetical protein
MRCILTVSLLLFVTFACLGDCVELLFFSLNRSYIARNICEKKDEPGNSCQGCCLLRKQLEQEDRKEQSPPPRTQREIDDFQPVPATFPMIIRAPLSGGMMFSSLTFLIAPPPGKNIDHPPEVSYL